MIPSGRGASGDLLADRRFVWGRACARDGDYSAAADLFEQAVALAPAWAAGWFALGEARARAGASAAAVEAFRRSQACDARDPFGAGLRLAQLGAAEPPSRAPEAYVAALFDDYAPRFDAHLLETLGYRAPALIAAALDVAAPGRIFARALDLGCGTGLAARALGGRVLRFEGADLSAAMLARARESGLYAALAQEDIVDFLSAQAGESADLVIAADVFVYLGDLAPVLEAIARALSAGGVCAFTVERAEADGWRLKANLRYAHSRAYVEGVACDAGLLVVGVDEAAMRREAGVDAACFVIVLARP